MGECRRVIVPVLCVALLGVLAGCGGKADLAFRLPEGAVKTLKDSTDLTSTTDIMGQNMEEKQQVVNTMEFTVQGIDDEGVTTVSVKTDMAGSLLDAMLEMMPQEALEGISSATLTVVIGPKGDVRSVTGMEPVVEVLVAQARKAMDEQIKSMPPQAMAMMGSQMNDAIEGMGAAIRNMAGDEAVRKNLDAVLGFYPPKPVGVKDTWSRSYEVMMPVPMQATTEYTVSARGGGVTNIDFKTTYSPLPGAAIDLGAMKMEFLLNGTETGTMQVNESTGWISASSSTMDLTGSIDMGMAKANVAMQGTSYVEGE